MISASGFAVFSIATVETHVNELPSSLPMPVLLGVGLVLGLFALMLLLLPQ